MKILLVFLALAFSSFAADPIDVSASPVVNLVDLGNSGSIPEGKIVKLQFGWVHGDALAAWNGKAHGKGFLLVTKRVVLPDDTRAKAWFATLPTRDNSPTTQSAYVRIHHGALSEIVGRDVRDGQPTW